MKENVLYRYFIASVAIVLIVTAIAKLYGAIGDAKILGTFDPILLISRRSVMMVVAVIELEVAMILVFGRCMLIKQGAILWLGMNFLLYHFGLWMIQAGRPCPCLGHVMDALHLRAQTATAIANFIMLYMLAGSCFYFVQEHWLGRSTGEVSNESEGDSAENPVSF